MSGPSYCRVTFDDGSADDLIMTEFQRLHAACLEYVKTGKDTIFLGQESCGSHCFFFISKVQDCIISTPEIRATMEDINRMLKEEEKENKSWE